MRVVGVVLTLDSIRETHTQENRVLRNRPEAVGHVTL